HLLDRLLLDEERVAFERYRRKVRFLAMRFAAKEACVKAMGTGFANGMWIRDVGVVSDPLGKPLVIFSERGKAKCEALGIGEAHVSLTDEAGLVVAMAIMMRV
ncbi:MAG: holo-ACP synthase, partial [Pseudomonadota bacterium]